MKVTSVVESEVVFVARTEPSSWRSPAALVGTVVVTTGLVTAAFATVLGAGCDDPGNLVRRDGVVVLEGGCLPADDVVVPAAVDTTDPDTVRP